VIYQKWPTTAQRSAATTREAKKLQMMDVQALRAQVKHWPGDKSPSLTLQHFRGAQKVEAFYSRNTRPAHQRMSHSLMGFFTLYEKSAEVDSKHCQT
jgi:hypothetical protein